MRAGVCVRAGGRARGRVGVRVTLHDCALLSSLAHYWQTTAAACDMQTTLFGPHLRVCGCGETGSNLNQPGLHAYTALPGLNGCLYTSN